MALIGSDVMPADQLWFWWLYSLIAHIFATIMVFQCIAHGTAIISDLCTKSRMSVRWRSRKPVIDKPYTLLAICSEISMVNFTISVVVQCMLMWRVLNDSAQAILIVSGICWQLGKQFMYFLFLLRLHIVYMHSAYRYPSNKLYAIAAISSCVTIMSITFSLLFCEIEIIYYANHPLFMLCNAFYPLFHVFTVGVLDGSMSVGFLYAFIKPLREIVKITVGTKSTRNILRKGQSNSKVDNCKKLLEPGRKSLTLTAATIITTTMFVSLVLLTDSVILGPIDSCINISCIMFMTPYYPPDTFYERFCLPAIKLSQMFKIYNFEPKRKDGNRPHSRSVDTYASRNSVPLSVDDVIEIQETTIGATPTTLFKEDEPTADTYEK